MSDYPIQPRLNPEGTGYICDTCDRKWRVGDSSGCPECVSNLDISKDWRHIDSYRPGHDPARVFVWASFRVKQTDGTMWWTSWQDWSAYWNGSAWRPGDGDERVVRYRVSHWRPRFAAPKDWAVATYKQGNCR